MKQLVEVIAKALVDNPDEVVVTETQKDKAIIVNLKVASSDIGKVNPEELQSLLELLYLQPHRIPTKRLL